MKKTPSLQIMIIARDTVSGVNGNPRIYNNMRECKRHCEIIAQQDPTAKDVKFTVVGWLDRHADVSPIIWLVTPFEFTIPVDGNWDKIIGDFDKYEHEFFDNN